ncbi:MAG: amidohydrolase [Sphingomonadales bacterium]|nr:MAG: amidohydrolase [Sphingomonadales bacterium]
MADDVFEPLPYKLISADSHIAEPPSLYTDYLDPQYRDRAPRLEVSPHGGSLYVIDGVNDGKPFVTGMGSLSAAGVDPKAIRIEEWKWDDIHKGSWDPKARLAAQDLDGVGAEIIFPSIGMVLCNHPDVGFKSACFTAYNRWMADFRSHAPDRLFAVGQTAVASVEEAIADFQRLKEMGFSCVMLPAEPATEFEYDDRRFDPLWEAAVALQLPISFHILTSRKESKAIADAVVEAKEKNRGRSMAHYHHTLIRANQDLISTFLWGRVFERFPELKMVCAEADAGWVPHFAYRSDHFYRRHRFQHHVEDMSKLPSQWIASNVYFTFQDDLVAFESVSMMNRKRMLWANDFPHSDSTWPWSQQMLAYHTQHLSDEDRRAILRDNHIECFNLPLN